MNSDLEALLSQPNLTTCPHPRELPKGRIVFSVDGEGMAMCQPCFLGLRDLTQRAEAGEVVTLDEVSATMLPLGYTSDDVNQFWGDLHG